MVHQYLPDFPYVELSTEMQGQNCQPSLEHGLSRCHVESFIAHQWRELQRRTAEFKWYDRQPYHSVIRHVLHVSGPQRSGSEACFPRFDARSLEGTGSHQRWDSEYLGKRPNGREMAALTQTHLRFGIQLEYFNPLGNALRHAMKETSDGVWSDEIKNAWRHLFAHCSALLLVQHKAALNRKQQVKKLEIQVKGAMEYDIYSSPRKLPILEQTT